MPNMTVCGDIALLSHYHTFGRPGGFEGVDYWSCQGYKACVIMASCER
jgi:hypothetical protein